MPPDASITCEQFSALLRQELEDLCHDWNAARSRDQDECPERMSVGDWWTHLSTRFPDLSRLDAA